VGGHFYVFFEAFCCNYPFQDVPKSASGVRVGLILQLNVSPSRETDKFSQLCSK
jgi:hypothetical protein